MSEPLPGELDSPSPGTGVLRAGGPSGLIWLPLTVVVIIADQLSKAWIVEHFALYERRRIFSLLDITLMYNTGAAFSFLSDASGWQRWLFVALAVVVGAGIIGWMGRLRGRSQALLSCSLALILAGALGNVIDRLRIGHVVDFVHAHWNAAYFPAFNVADSAITIGAGLLLLDAWLEHRARKPA